MIELIAICGLGYFFLSLAARKSNEASFETNGSSENLATEIVPVRSKEGLNHPKEFFKYLEPSDGCVAKTYRSETTYNPPFYVNTGGNHSGIGIPIGGGSSTEWREDTTFFGGTDLKPSPTKVDKVEFEEKWSLYAHGDYINKMCSDLGIDVRHLGYPYLKVGYSNLPPGLTYAFRNINDKSHIRALYVGQTKSAAIKSYCFSRRLPLSVTAACVGGIAASIWALSVYNDFKEKRSSHERRRW